MIANGECTFSVQRRPPGTFFGLNLQIMHSLPIRASPQKTVQFPLSVYYDYCLVVTRTIRRSRGSPVNGYRCDKPEVGKTVCMDLGPIKTL